MSTERVPDPAGWNRIDELIEKNQELRVEITVLREEITRLERANKIMEQRLRRIGDAVVEGRVVDGQ